MRGNERVPGRDVGGRRGINVSAGVAYRGVEDSDARVLEALEISPAEGMRIRASGCQLFVIQRQQAQHVDHRGFANQIDCGG